MKYNSSRLTIDGLGDRFEDLEIECQQGVDLGLMAAAGICLLSSKIPQEPFPLCGKFGLWITFYGIICQI